MADALNPDEEALSESRPETQIAEMRAELQRLRVEMAQLKSDIAAASGKVRLQGGGAAQVSGGNGNWTITVNLPSGGTVNGTLDCSTDPPVLRGTVTF